MGKNSAEYMRAYRAQRKAARERFGNGDGADEIARLSSLNIEWLKRIAELEEEVRHLKAELAKAHRTPQTAIDRAEQFLLEQAEPGDLAYTRKAQQAQRDAILRKINRGG